MKQRMNQKLTGFHRFISRFIPPYALLPLISCFLANQFAYMGARGINHLRGVSFGEWELALDGVFQISPIWAVPYIGSFFWWVLCSVLISRKNPSCYLEYCRANVLGKAICFVLFLLFPTTIIRPEVPAGAFSFLLKIVYFFDKADNLFPSIHCFVSWLLFRHVCKSGFSMRFRVFSCAVAIVIFLSTLYTKQHVVLDVLGGILVAEISTALARFVPLWRKRAISSAL